MGNQIESSGLSKFWWKNQSVQTKYHTIHQIPIMTIDKKETYISASGKKVAIVHFDDSTKSLQVQEKLKNTKGLEVYYIPNQNSKQSFDNIKSVNKESMGKLTINGSEAHPLFKYLKKNCPEFYNYSTKSAGKRISSKVGIFIVENSTDGDNTIVSYYNEQKLDRVVEKLGIA